MRKNICMVLLLGMCLALAGCGGEAAPTEHEQMEQMEQQLTALQAELDELKASMAEGYAPGEVTEENSGTTPQAPDPHPITVIPPAPDPYGVFDEKAMRSAISDVVKRIDSVVPAGSINDQRAQYLELDRELELLEDELDYYQDVAERDFRNGDITFREYRDIVSALDELENKLEKAENALERTFKVLD
ncbi:MAG: hypothetical protein Q4B48_02550 [Syntrophomonadaceae bacterium]|nr:hypothetical protein [Syntrophomonadaceae bacterium]